VIEICYLYSTSPDENGGYGSIVPRVQSATRIKYRRLRETTKKSHNPDNDYGINWRVETVIDIRQRSGQNPVERHSEENSRGCQNEWRNIVCNPKHSEYYQDYVGRSQIDSTTSESCYGGGPKFHGRKPYAGKTHFPSI